ncbi:helix-turn-helix transcriptional regulator [Actinopolymorpha sp. NPDC004070]|uniref:helix-turn-helix transcriptional regulator n=1 Tax=Actinopolymorpha sp. NPDC004070 TaxID=3154548 RepID=UPI0033A0A33A
MTGTSLERRFRPWVDVIGDSLASPSTGFPVDLLLETFHTSFGCALSTWQWRDGDGSYGFHLNEPVPGWPRPDAMGVWAGIMTRHPLINWFAVTQDLSATSIGRVPQNAESRRVLSFLRAELLDDDFEQQISIPYRISRAATYRTFVIAKSGPDFSDDDVSLARRIQPLLCLLARQANVLDECAAGQPDVSPTAMSVGLTGRQLAVLQLLAEGLTAEAIARRLAISPRTVHVHLDHLYRKLGVRDRLKAVLVARDLGLVLARERPRQVAVTPQPTDHPLVRDVAGQRFVAWRPGIGSLSIAGAP